MSKVQRSSSDIPSRRDSFSRMLELEKQYKMQRIQQDHASSSGTPPSRSIPSTNANLPPFRARRISGHPPLSHQTQIMKAERRATALPSLSISIPPSPTQTLAAKADGLAEDPQGGKEEHVKTVTFSGPEEDKDSNSSDDNSSICQSPSWEQYGQKKKKSKKRDSERGSKEKGEKALKKKGNKLSKVPQDGSGVKPLTAADRSKSAPELELYHGSSKEGLAPGQLPLQEKMANRQVDDKVPVQELKPKSKSKGFLSGFRLQHGNVAAVQKLLESSRTSVDDGRSRQVQQPIPPPSQTLPAAGTGPEPGHTDPRKPASIRSIVSNSTPSISSQEKRSSSARHSLSSTHGRSQSLLSSTLNKLKGPSYLYYRPSTEESEPAQSRRPSSVHEVDPTIANVPNTPEERRPERPNRIGDTSQPTRDVRLKHRRAMVEPSSESVPRVRRHRMPVTETRDSSSEHETPTLVQSKSRRVQVETQRNPSQESVMAMVVAQEKQSKAERRLQHSKPHSERPVVAEELAEAGQSRAMDPERKRFHHHQYSAYAPPPQELPAQSEHSSDSKSWIPEAEDLTKIDSLGRAEPMRTRPQEDDQLSVGTHTSTIRPQSQARENVPVDSGKRYSPLAVSPESSASEKGASPGSSQEPVASRTEPIAEDLIMFGPEDPSPMLPPLQPQRSADYFSFVSESYAPPSLELRSPTERRFPSPPIAEEPEEDGNEELSRNSHLQDLIPVSGAFHASSGTGTIERRAITHPMAPNRPSQDQKAKDSPAISAHFSDSDVPAFERLGIPAKTAKILAGAETASNATSQSHPTEPSRGTSERSSSSTYDDAPPSPSSATTQDSSRPQSRKGIPPVLPEPARSPSIVPTAQTKERVPRGDYRPPFAEDPSTSNSRSTSRGARSRDDEWDRTPVANEVEPDHNRTFSRLDASASSPSLVATPTSVSVSGTAKNHSGDNELPNKGAHRLGLPPRTQSALDMYSTAKVPPPLKPSSLHAAAGKGVVGSSVSLPNSPPPDMAEEVFPRKSALKASRTHSDNGPASSALVSAGAAYLQEARKTAPMSMMPGARAMRPHFAHKNSSSSVKSGLSTGSRSEPLAKMLVECCNCKFFHDMPSRVYECMAKPDSVVEDKLLGVSAAITTMVKCPWCAHGMTTQCCSGYAAVVYLKEKLHGK
ncbi:hypothetical protein F4780DRAFT_69186 [Xylariomycetidae sp. FL0641]|nr:hypothetical protein F4780DRAFT_69186 [Xylariomycetidae sp. FL0641]